MLETTHLSVNFGGHYAVNQVSCRFTPGVLTAIVGPNGAGKTTYFNLISGQIKATAGKVLIHNRDITHSSVSSRVKQGIGRGFQLTNLFPNLSVVENLRLCLQAVRKGKHWGGMNFWSLADSYTALLEASCSILDLVHLLHKKDLPISALSHGEQRKVEVAILLALDPQIYMFDEPTAGMSKDEVPMILELIEKLKFQKDKIILLVEHKLEVVRQLADRVIVLHKGALIADGTPSEVMNQEIVQEVYLGHHKIQ
ncbi:MAG: ABC transporter ATP-binding protein [Gammaproteobacteria bacterium]|nr:ABC transporter ATP-binding protein [Gammaproteobacteria bacterium]